MTRTTLDLDPAILRELRRRGHQEGKSVGQVASELLSRTFNTEAHHESPPFVWTAMPLGPALVDLDDPGAVRRVLDAAGDDRP